MLRLSQHKLSSCSFLVLTCITEDQFANALLNDPNLVFKVKLHRAPMRHRSKSSAGTWAAGAFTSRPLACSVMDLMVEFIRSHMMKRFPCQVGSLLGLCAYEKFKKMSLFCYHVQHESMCRFWKQKRGKIGSLLYSSTPSLWVSSTVYSLTKKGPGFDWYILGRSSGRHLSVLSSSSVQTRQTSSRKLMFFQLRFR